MLLVGAGGALPGASDLEQHALSEIARHELYRERQPSRGQTGYHGQCRMTRDVEWRARLARIGAFRLCRILRPARRIHRAGAQQYVDLAQRVLDHRDHLKTAAAGLHIIAGADERAAQQTATGELTVIPGTLAQPGSVDGPRLAL